MVMVTEQIELSESKVFRVIDKVLTQVFGRDATLLIYKHLEHNYGLKRNEIGERIEVFAQGLEDFLKSGALVIEKKILEDINSGCHCLPKIELGNTNNEESFVSQIKLYMHKS
jgi:hypothetical protein